jgi:hypothetical protein
MTDYLWDKSGEIDPEIERLERALGRLAQSSPPPPLSGSVRLQAGQGRPALSTPSRWMGVALLAASLALVVGGVTLAFRFRRPVPSWQVTTAAGLSSLPVGGWLETGDRERASFNVADIGTVVVEPHTRLRLLNTRAGHHSLELTRGTLHATIWAPPNQFFVETPSTLAVDLGCAYTLTVDDEGAGLVSVLVGWVGFKWHDRESFIPAGSACATRPHIGPGTPYNERVSPAYREALSTIDFAPREPSASNALTLVLNESTERDEVTLWHLLSRVPEADRDRVFDRLSAFVAPPPGVTRDGVRAGNRQVLDAWWDGLGLGSTSLWRTWSQQWNDNSNRR